MTITATRYHDFSCGHRVVGHESKCAYLHGHNYRVHFACAGSLDAVGRVLDFSVINSLLCEWLEENWDHRFLAWENDPLMKTVTTPDDAGAYSDAQCMLNNSIVWVPFNPTAENMADYLLRTICPVRLSGTGVECVKVVVEETRKCSAMATLP